MPWYQDIDQLTHTTGTNEWWNVYYHPAAEVPVSGIYKCKGCKKEVTSNRGDIFPPQNHHQHPSKDPILWELIVRTNTSGK